MPLHHAQLPTYKDIGLQVLHFQQFKRLMRGEAVERTAQEVEKLYRKKEECAIKKRC